MRSCTTVDNEHGRLETRQIFALATHNTQLEIAGIKQVARVCRERELLKSDRVEKEEIFLITNMPHEQLNAEEFLRLKREYWAIENKLHYRKDFVFEEDRSTIRAGHGPENMSCMRNFAIGLLSANGVQNIKRCVDNLRYGDPSQFYSSLLLKAA